MGEFACRKNDKIDTSPALKLRFSTDTVFFDTVFTTIGSVTQRLMVYNNNGSKVQVSSISLAGGVKSDYKLNIDGVAASSLTNVEIPAHDSIFIFVRVTIDPNNHNTPLILTDSIEFLTNGNLQNVKLIAWGQDAWFHKNESLKGTFVWDSIKPHVIYGYLRVDTNGSLTILPGTKVYFHSNGYLTVSMNSSLFIQGNLQHPVRFQGDRLDEFYRDLPGQWSGILLRSGSKKNSINYAIIKNGNYGVEIDSSGTTPGTILLLDNTIIENMANDGLYAYAASVVSTNCVIGNCGGTCISLLKGGSYEFRQLTLANYWTTSVRYSPALFINNYTSFAHGDQTNDLVKAYFGNSIIYGSEDNEISVDSSSLAQFTYTFNHCLLKTTKNIAYPGHFDNCWKNEDPRFIDPANYKFAIDSASFAIGKGIPMGVDFDILGNLRTNPTDLGAYQYKHN